MRTALATALLTLAMLFGGGVARAQGVGEPGSGRCMVRPMSIEASSLASRLSPSDNGSGTTDGEPAVSTVRTAAAVMARPVMAPSPWRQQSRAPVMCTDPSQPGCHVDAPDAPTHHGWSVLADDGGDVSARAFDVPPAGGIAHTWAAPLAVGIPSAPGRAPWRPPTC